MFLAARLAALQLLRDQGVFALPARKISGKVVGLSGTEHEAWIEHPIERLKIRDFDFRDKAWALITFEDGRQLRFHLIGSGILDEAGQVIPSISLDLKDTDLAGMSPEELRKRTTLLPDGLCWHSHWNDAELQTQANDAAGMRTKTWTIRGDSSCTHTQTGCERLSFTSDLDCVSGPRSASWDTQRRTH
jgi:hypothetical protein